MSWMYINILYNLIQISKTELDALIKLKTYKFHLIKIPSLTRIELAVVANILQYR